MRILVEPEAFRYGRCGRGRYYASVCRGLRDAGVEVDIPLVASGNENQSAWFQLYTPWRWPSMRERMLSWSGVLSRRLFHRKLASGRYDIVLLTSVHYQTDFLKYCNGTPFLMVCHDTMRSLVIPGGAIDAWSDPFYRLLYLARRAARVICISESTRRDLLQCLPAPTESVVVVPSGNMLPLSAKAGIPVPGLPEKFFLFVGSRQVRKNFNGTIQALQPLLRKRPDIKLVCTGPFNPHERDFLEALGVGESVVGLDAGDAQLVTLYERALGLVFASFYEGFGLPVLEAMTLGCPVVASDIGSLREVAGDAALFVSAGDADGLARACERLALEPELRTQLAEAGRNRAGFFTFEKMIKAFLEQLEAAVRQSNRTPKQ